MLPDASMATRSVNVPPTSMPTPVWLIRRSQSDFLFFLGRLVDRLEQAMQLHLVHRRFIRRAFLHDGDEMRELGAVRLQERPLAAGGAAWRHVGRAAIQFLDDAEWREPSAAASRNDL